MRSKKGQRAAWLSLLSGGLYAGGSWFAARALADRLISPEGLAPATEGRENLIAALRETGAFVADYRHRGSARDPVELAAVFASSGEPQRRPTILFLHGKGGNAAEWRPDALRALRLGYNALLPDLRGHRPSGGSLVTYGFLEKEDLANSLNAARERFGLDPTRLGLHGCSAGSTVALEFAADNVAVRALWLESPYAEPRAMARHYLSLATGLPPWLLGLTARWAVRHAIARVRRELALGKAEKGLDRVDPLAAVARVRASVCLVYGEEDELVPPRFAERLATALPPGSSVWRAAKAGHCHHENEPARVVAQEYERRWREFFQKSLPVG
ncbi:MAG: alpha/beta hydrolase [Thermoanaerobaculia bacterium]